MEGRTSCGVCFSDWPLSLGLGMCVIPPHSILCRYTLVLASLLLPPAHPPPPSWHPSLDSTRCFLVPVKLLFWKPCFGGTVLVGPHGISFSSVETMSWSLRVWKSLPLCGSGCSVVWLCHCLLIFWDALLASNPGLLPKKLCWTVVYRPFVLM